MSNKEPWFLETGFFNAEGEKAINSLKYELTKVLMLAANTDMTNNQLLVLQGNLCKLIGDQINGMIVSNK